MNIKASDANEFNCVTTILWRLIMPIGQIFFKKLGSLDKIFSKKIIIFISNKVCKDLKANKAR